MAVLTCFLWDVFTAKGIAKVLYKAIPCGIERRIVVIALRVPKRLKSALSGWLSPDGAGILAAQRKDGGESRNVV